MDANTMYLLAMPILTVVLLGAGVVPFIIKASARFGALEQKVEHVHQCIHRVEARLEKDE